MPREPFIPTRTEPHRLCELTHKVFIAAWGAATLIFLFSGLGAVVLLVFGLAVGLLALRVMHGGKTLRETVKEEHEEDEAAIAAYHKAQTISENPDAPQSAIPGQRFVRPMWARMAVASDIVGILYLLSVPVSAVVTPAHPRPLRLTDLLFVIPGVLYVVFDTYAHCRGTTTQPPLTAKPVYSDSVGSR